MQLNRKTFFCISSSIAVALAPFFLIAQKTDSIIKTGSLLPLPIVARSIETNWAFGAALSGTFHLNSTKGIHTRTSNLQALALYSLRKQFVAAINGSIYFPGERFILNQRISYSYYPDKFWGLGKNTPNSNKEDYNSKQFYIYLHPQVLIKTNFFLGLLYEFQNVWDINYVAGGLFDQQNVLGRKGYHVSGLGLSLTYDSRNNAFAPDRGAMLQFYFNHFDPIFASDYRYTNYVVDLRKFMRTYGQQVLALRAYGFFNAGEVPLRSLAAFGGSSLMRGFYEGRWRDYNQVVLQAEYRIPLIWRFGLVAFGGLGNVEHDLANFDFTYLKYSFGGGLRFALSKSERLNLRLDYGFGGHDENGFYFQLGEAF